MPTKLHFIFKFSVTPAAAPSLSIFHSPLGGRALLVRTPLPTSGNMTAGHAHLGLRCLLHVLLFISILRHVNSSDADTLLELKDSFTNGDKLTTWDASTSPCKANRANWEGVLCANNIIWGIKLEGKELGGNIDTKILSNLPSLIMISFQNNSLEGEFPNFQEMPRLRSIFLTGNKFSGEIPANTFEGMRRLKKLYLAKNQFEGQIPLSLTTLPRLKELMLENNQFEGDIPPFTQPTLTYVNFANNHLHGVIPEGLQKSPASQFSGNPELCGTPLGQCKRAETSIGTIIMIVLVVVAAVASIIAAIVILQQFGPSSTRSNLAPCYKATSPDLGQMEHGNGKASAAAAANKVDLSLKLTFLRDDTEKFDLPQLMKASAEILGGGVFGSSYKAALTRQKVFVVKRFRHMNHVPKEDFVKHMRRLGKLNHPNLVPLVAFYYRKEEKLLVADYIKNLSLAVHLHGNRSSKNQSLDWPARLNIVKGVARGLLHLYNELPSIIAPHGHLKSSNVLLNRKFEPVLTDFGLIPITNQENARELMIAYKSPEYKRHGRITKKTDVWSLGVLILETMTGRFPANSFHQGKGNDIDLTNFVDSVMHKECQIDMFDKEMGGFDKCNEGQMVKLLKIGLSCCEPDVDKRWDITEVVERIEEVREKDDDNDHQ